MELLTIKGATLSYAAPKRLLAIKKKLHQLGL
jgi:hypothetical protein